MDERGNLEISIQEQRMFFQKTLDGLCELFNSEEAQLL